MKQSDLNEILTKHKRWLSYEEGGEPADLQGADLRWADLRGADLQGANLRGAYLRGADLQGADLQGADLRYANLRSADLRSADLQVANLQGANLRYADLQRADLQVANLQGANLQGANLLDANLDYSCFPLWCGSKGIKLDRRLFLQLLAHICAVEVDDEECKNTQEYLMTIAKQSHVAKWLFGEWKERVE